MQFHPPIITAIYAAVMIFMYLILSVNVTRARYKNRVSLLDGDKPELRQKMRIHGNFSEYVPLALLTISFIEIAGASKWWVHVFALFLLCGRILHATGLKADKGGTFGRKTGMYFTVISLAGSAIWILVTLLPTQL